MGRPVVAFIHFARRKVDFRITSFASPTTTVETPLPKETHTRSTFDLSARWSSLCINGCFCQHRHTSGELVSPRIQSFLQVDLDRFVGASVNAEAVLLPDRRSFDEPFLKLSRPHNSSISSPPSNIRHHTAHHLSAPSHQAVNIRLSQTERVQEFVTKTRAFASIFAAAFCALFPAAPQEFPITDDHIAAQGETLLDHRMLQLQHTVLQQAEETLAARRGNEGEDVR